MKKNIAFLIVGLVIGGATGFLVAKKLEQKRVDAELNRINEELQEEFGERVAADMASTDDFIVEAQKRQHIRLIRRYDKGGSHLEPIGEAEYDYNHPVDSDEDELQGPVHITMEEFLSEHPEFDKLSVYYYADGTLADENEEPVDDIDGWVGMENLQKFGQGSEDENVVYVRNSRISTDLEINRVPGQTYKEATGQE